MKTTVYTARTMQGALSMARQDGHVTEPLQRFWINGSWRLTYPAKSLVVTLVKLRASRLKAWLAGFTKRATIDTQRQILRELRHG